MLDGSVDRLEHKYINRAGTRQVGSSFAASRCLGSASSRGPFLAIFGVIIVRDDIEVSATDHDGGVNGGSLSAFQESYSTTSEDEHEHEYNYVVLLLPVLSFL
jgi:hypothetical protein